MDKPTDHDDLLDAIKGDRYQILLLLFEENELPSSTIRDRAEIPEGSKHYQLSLLESWGLIKRVGSRYTNAESAGQPATIYTITNDGRSVIYDIASADEAEMVSKSKNEIDKS